MHSVSVVVLTMGDRPEGLAAAIESARAQTGVELEVVLVVNGGDPDRSLADVVVEPGENTGIPGGRNLGAAAASGDFLCFLDDDAWYASDDVLVQAVQEAESMPKVAVVGLGITDPEGNTAKRHHPMLGKRPDRTCQATSFPGGACVIRKSAFTEVEGFFAEYFYGLEETDLSWRLIDCGWNILYAPLLKVKHPVSAPEGHHTDFYTMTARNRVWLAWRLLPIGLGFVYVMNWLVIATIRKRQEPQNIAAIYQGTLDGWKKRPKPREPIVFHSTIKLTKLKRPPVI